MLTYGTYYDYVDNVTKTQLNQKCFAHYSVLCYFHAYWPIPVFHDNIITNYYYEMFNNSNTSVILL